MLPLAETIHLLATNCNWLYSATEKGQATISLGTTTSMSKDKAPKVEVIYGGFSNGDQPSLKLKFEF